MYAVGRILSRLVGLLATLSSAAVALMMVHIALDVTLKYLFNTPIPATLTIVSNYYMPAAVFLPLALVEKKNAHISVEILTQNFGAGVQRLLTGLAWIMSGAVFAILAYRTALDALERHATGTFVMEQDYKIDIWPPYYFLPIGFGLVVLLLAYRLIVSLSGRRSGLGEGTDGDSADPEPRIVE